MKDDRVYLQHIRECLRAIERHVAEEDPPTLRLAVEAMLRERER